MSYNATTPRLPDPNTTPAGPGFVSVSLTDNSPGILHKLNTGASVAVKYAGNYWTLNISYPQLLLSEGATLSSFLYGLGGSFTNFYVSLPVYDFPANGSIGTGVEGYSFAVTLGDTANSVHSTSSDVANLTAGDMLKFGSSHKIYMITNIDSTSTPGTFKIFTNSDVITDTGGVLNGAFPNDIKFRVRLKGNSPTFSINNDGLYESISLSLDENIFED